MVPTWVFRTKIYKQVEQDTVFSALKFIPQAPYAVDQSPIVPAKSAAQPQKISLVPYKDGKKSTEKF
jgi:hypothetical protein